MQAWRRSPPIPACRCQCVALLPGLPTGSWATSTAPWTQPRQATNAPGRRHNRVPNIALRPDSQPICLVSRSRRRRDHRSLTYRRTRLRRLNERRESRNDQNSLGDSSRGAAVRLRSGRYENIGTALALRKLVRRSLLLTKLEGRYNVDARNVGTGQSCVARGPSASSRPALIRVSCRCLRLSAL
jgi:hypothetical protein